MRARVMIEVDDSRGELVMVVHSSWVRGDGSQGEAMGTLQTFGLLEQAKISLLQGVPFDQPEDVEVKRVEVVGSIPRIQAGVN